MAAYKKPLAGLRILDLSLLLPGAFLTQLLADLGAEITKIEPPEGDPMRYFPPLERDVSSFFKTYHRNKKLIRVNLKEKKGQALVHRMLKGFDAAVCSMRPATAKRLAIDGKTLLRHNPKLVYLSLSAPTKGPWKGMAAHDLNFVGLSGFLDNLAPRIPPVPIADLSGAFLGGIHLLAALHGKKGVILDLSLMDAMEVLMAFPLGEQRTLAAQAESSPMPQLHLGEFPAYRMYRTKDEKYMAVCALEPKFWRLFCKTIGRPDWSEFSYLDPTHRKTLCQGIEKIFKSRPQAHWTKLFLKADCCVTPVRTLKELAPAS